jgi:hypothetical protein
MPWSGRLLGLGAVVQFAALLIFAILTELAREARGGAPWSWLSIPFEVAMVVAGPLLYLAGAACGFVSVFRRRSPQRAANGWLAALNLTLAAVTLYYLTMISAWALLV